MNMETNKELFCRINKIEENSTSNNLSYPKDMYTRIKERGNNVLSVLTDRKIVLFPTNATSGLYTKISIKRTKTGLDDSFFLALRTVTSKFNLKTLFTTGMCIKQEECFWEGIFEYEEN